MCRNTIILSRSVGDSDESEVFHADRDDMLLIGAGNLGRQLLVITGSEANDRLPGN